MEGSENKHDIDGWFEFLEARKRVIDSATKNGYEPHELEDLVNIRGLQTILLMQKQD